MEVHELKAKVTKLEECQLLQLNWLSRLESLIQIQPAPTDIIYTNYMDSESPNNSLPSMISLPSTMPTMLTNMPTMSTNMPTMSTMIPPSASPSMIPPSASPSMIPPSASQSMIPPSVSSPATTNMPSICPLPSEAINKAQLADPQTVLAKYAWKMKGPSKAGSLCVKLAREAFFGQDILQQCTVRGCRDLPALPEEELRSLKQVLFQQYPQFQNLNLCGVSV